MSEDRELVERFAAIDATPRASWVAELRADLDAAWDTGELPWRHAPQLEPPRHSPTRTWLVASISAAAVAILIVALVVLPRNRDDVQTPSNTAAPVTTTPTPTTTPGTTTPTTTTASSSTVPVPGAVVVTSAGRIDQAVNDGSFVFNADGSTLALAGEGYGLRLYDPVTLTMERELECPTTTVQSPGITSFTWNPQVAATWDAESRTLITDLMWANLPAGCQVVFSADGSRAARGEGYTTYDKISDVRTLLWDTTDGSLIDALEGGSPRFSLDGTRIITQVMGTGAVVGGTKVWDATTGQLVSEFDIGQVFAPPKLSGDRTRVLIGVQLGGVVLDARTFDPVADVPFAEQASSAPGAINHDGTLVASTNGSTVSVWDVATGALVKSLTMKAPAVGGIAFNPTGTQLLLSEFESASVWDVATGEEVFRIDASATPPTFSPDGALLAIANIGGQPTFFDTATGEQLDESESSISPFGFIAFSPDGSTLAVDNGSSVDLWTFTRT